MLYQRQQTTVDKLENAYQQQLSLTENHYYLSGEMGVGKTYMGAQIAINHQAQGVLIVVPDLVSKKWLNVLQAMHPKNEITVVDNHFCKTSQLNFNPNHITIIPNQYFNRLFNTNELHTIVDRWETLNHDLASLNTWVQATHNVKYQRALNYIHYLVDQPFLIYDEIHQAQNSKLDCLDLLFHPHAVVIDTLRDYGCLANNSTYQNPALFLTGTIFNVDIHALIHLISVTNHRLLNYQNIQDANDLKSIAVFFAKIWRYISVSIALADINKTDKDNLHQTILPIKSIPLSEIEKSFYHLAVAQLDANTNTQTPKSIQRHRLYASNLLDYPERKPVQTIKAAKRRNTYLRYDQEVLLTLPLQDIKLTDTKKYQTLLANLKQHQHESTIIYANDYELIHQLVRELTAIGMKAKTLPKSLKAEHYSDYINHALADGYLFIVNPNDVTVGIDINAEFLIWYQLLTDMASIIQAQRRVYRLSSTHDSKVLFMPYQLTYQDELVDAISNSAKNNAASYGIQDKSELAKKTHILLEQLNK